MRSGRTIGGQRPDVLARLANAAQSRLPAPVRSPRARALGIVMCILLGALVVVAGTGTWP